jgi:hypothetical protein
MHLVQNDHPHREGKQGAQIAEGAGQLHSIESETPIGILRHYPNLGSRPALAESCFGADQ